MLFLRFQFFIFIFALSYSINITHSRYQPQYLGLFTLTNCDNKFECLNAQINENRMVVHHHTKQYSEDIELCTVDIGNDHEKILGILLDLTERNSSYTLDCRNNTRMNFKYDNQQILLFTYLSFELTRMVSSLALLDDTFIQTSITNQFMYPAYYFDHPFAIYSYEASFDEKIHRDGFIRIKNGLNISYGAILNLYQENSIVDEAYKNQDHTKDYTKKNQGSVVNHKYQGSDKMVAHNQNEICSQDKNQHSAWCLYTTLCPNDCLKTKDVNISNQTDVNYTLQLLTEQSITFITLVGESYSIELLQRRTDLAGFFITPYFTKTSSNTFIDTLMSSYENLDVILNFPGSFGFSMFLFYISDISRLLIIKDYIWEGILQREDIQEFIRDKLECKFIQILHKGFQCGDKFTFSMWKKIPRVFKRKVIKSMLGKKIVLKSFILLWKKRYYIKNVDYNRLMKQKEYYNPKKALLSKPFCDLKKPLCGPGEELIHSMYKEWGWKKSFGWNCRRCSNSFYKKSFGNIEKCQSCPYPMISNENRSLCFDPYKLEILTFSNVTMLMTITISFVLVLLITLTMIVFFVKRDTPIVLSANHKMSAIQLTTHLLLNVAPVLLILDRFSQTKCALFQIVIGLGFSLTVSVNISKTQKIFMIVSKQIIMSKSEILLTKASEWMIIGSMVLVNIPLHLYVLFYEQIQLLVEYHENPSVKEEYCSNENYIFFQIVFAGGLIIANGIQGIRGRKLPSQFRETNHVIYSSFISIVVIIAASAIYFSQQIKVERMMVVCVVTIILNSVHFVLLYTYKIFIILFKPHLNTRQAANQRRLKAFSD